MKGTSASETQLTTMGKKKRLAVRRKRGTGVLYFDQGTQDAIEKYQKESSSAVREFLYKERILPAFDKLVENLIFIHGFNKEEEPFESLKSDCISFLYETIMKFDPLRGSKAFSYFNVVARNWLIIKSKQRAKKRNRHVSIDDVHLNMVHKQIIENYSVVPAQDDAMIDAARSEEILDILRRVKKRITNDNEMIVIEAIIRIFSHTDELELLNKRAIFVYIRELSQLNPKQLSLALSQIKRYYRDVTNSQYSNFF
jgi:hypothetical protein